MTKIRMNFCAPVLIFAAISAALPVRAQSSSATIDSLASDLAALTARVAKLQGQITAADLAGTYALNAIQMELGGGSPARVSSYVFVGTAILSADGTGTFMSSGEKGNTLSISPNSSVSPFMSPNSAGGTSSFTWTYANGVLTSAGIPSLAVAVGGRILIGASANNSDGANVLLIFTRLQKAGRFACDGTVPEDNQTPA